MAVHTLVYSDDPPATRAFFRDVLGWLFVEHPESEPGWLIFKTGPSELGVHPTSGTYDGQAYSYPRHHSISLVCDDIEATVAELEAKGATFADEIQDLGFGLGTMLEVPGADAMLLYEPRHPTALRRLTAAEQGTDAGVELRLEEPLVDPVADGEDGGPSCPP